MKKFLLIILSVILVFGCTACDTLYTEYTPPTNNGGTTGGGNTGTTPSTPDEDVDEDAFTVTLHVADTSAGANLTMPQLTGVQAQWSNSNGVYTASFNQKTATAIRTDLDGEYRVTLTKIPDGYTYDPNAYEADNYNRIVEIALYPLRSLTGGAGTKFNQYQIRTTGAYRFTFSNPNEMQYFIFQPVKQGMYTMSTFIDVTANEVTPEMTKYDFPQVMGFKGTISGGGAEGSFTKNLKYPLNISASQAGGSFPFSISVTSTIALNKQGNFPSPVSVDFFIERDGEYTEDDMLNDMGYSAPYVAPPEDISAEFVTPEGTFRLFGNVNNDLSTFEVIKNGADGYYYYDINEDGAVDSGDKQVFVLITQNSIISYMASGGRNTTSNGFVDASLICSMSADDVYLYRQRYDVFINGGTIPPASSSSKVYLGYADCVNEDGVYPVTDELKEFLYIFSVCKRVFFDGTGDAEAAGYSADDDTCWLFACGYYG